MKYVRDELIDLALNASSAKLAVGLAAMLRDGDVYYYIGFVEKFQQLVILSAVAAVCMFRIRGHARLVEPQSRVQFVVSLSHQSKGGQIALCLSSPEQVLNHAACAVCVCVPVCVDSVSGTIHRSSRHSVCVCVVCGYTTCTATATSCSTESEAAVRAQTASLIGRPQPRRRHQ